MPYTYKRSHNTDEQYSFSTLPSVNMPRSSFTRNHGLKTNLNPGLLVPIFLDEALPGDTLSLNASSFCRMPTLLHPVFENLYLDTFYFAVPYRLVWENFKRMMGEQDNPTDSIDFTLPTMTPPPGGYDELSNQDYFGLPTQEDIDAHQTLPFRCLHLIWNEWFRDQDLQQSVIVDKDDAPDDPDDYKDLLPRGKRHDYFTSCRPWPQKGDAPTLPLGVTAPVIPSAASGRPLFDSNVTTGGSLVAVSGTQQVIWGATGDNTFIDWNTDTGLEADISGASAFNLNTLRLLVATQHLLERDARGGTRYTEQMRSHFGVISPDARQQRSEYLGGGTDRIQINVVESTTSAAVPVGALGAYGVGGGTNRGFIHSCTEHCFIIGIASIRADLNYQQGIERMWSRSTRLDHYYPDLQHLGEQAVLSKELFANGTANDNEVFGYQERWAEYKYKPSKITGQMRSNAATSLDTWHLAQDFATRPNLNANFIEEDPPIDRIVAVPTEPQFLLDMHYQYRCVRPMGVRSNPGLTRF